MNKINVSIKNDKREPNLGSLWKAEPNSEYYILADIGNNKYVCIALDDGRRWGDPAKTIEDATDGLTFVAHEFEMNISVE